MQVCPHMPIYAWTFDIYWSIWHYSIYLEFFIQVNLCLWCKNNFEKNTNFNFFKMNIICILRHLHYYYIYKIMIQLIMDVWKFKARHLTQFMGQNTIFMGVCIMIFHTKINLEVNIYVWSSSQTMNDPHFIILSHCCIESTFVYIT